MEPGDGIAACLECLEDHICVVAAGPPMVEQGESFQEICSAFQGLAIFYLLGDLNLTRYHWSLQRSTQARLFFLRKLKEQGTPDPVFSALSRTDSVFDAIVTDDLQAAARIENLSAPAWLPTGEYEDNYWYFKIVHSLARNSLTEASQQLVRFEAALEDRVDPRLNVCRGFIQRLEPDFWMAFAEFVDARRASSGIEHDDGRLVDEPWRAAFSQVSIEALAWMKMALASGFQPRESEYRMCPSVVLGPCPAEHSPEIFQQLESRFNL